MPRKIGSEAVGRRQAGTFADENETKARSEMETDGIADGDPALLHEGDCGDGPACNKELREKVCEQGNGIALDGQSGEAIGDDDREIAGAGSKLGK